ncbi:MAG: TetR/AcrR family transcriptional regulator [Opitutaceae bacterium]|nr:TetR/AcrR family transcriptional regulator [Cytophagales bacterium]
MEWNLDININDKLYLRDPKTSDLGKNILRNGIIMIEEIGIEDFTFKKLAKEMNTTESSIYRYFENKQMLLLYVLSWYWQWLEYLVVFKSNNIENSEKKVDILLDVLLLNTKDYIDGGPIVDKRILHMLVIKESSKSYLNHDVTKFNEYGFYKPYKALCSRIAGIFKEINPEYPYSRNLASTVLLMSRNLYFFMQNLPSLTDFTETKDISNTKTFLKDTIYKSLKVLS